MYNKGGIRADLTKGDVTYGDILDVAPFENKICGHGEKKRFTVRKMSGTVGVERIFPIESPNIESIEVNKVGKVRRAKLYYLRKLTGKAARIKEKRRAITAE